MTASCAVPLSISDNSVVSRNAPASIRRSLSSEQSLAGSGAVDCATSSAVAGSVKKPTFSFNGTNNNALTSVHIPTATHRIQRFINIFSSSDQQKKHWEAKSSSPPIRLPSRRQLKHSVTAVAEPISVYDLSIQVRVADVQKQGEIMHQEVSMGDSMKGDRHKWATYWAVLHSSTLYLCRQVSSHSSEEAHEVLNIPRNARKIDLKSTIVDIAYEYWCLKDRRKAYVFRVVTQQQTEHHFQTKCESEMLKWIKTIRSASSALISSRNDGINQNKMVSHVAVTNNKPTATKSNSVDSIFLDSNQQQRQVCSGYTTFYSDHDHASLSSEGRSVKSDSRSDLTQLLSADVSRLEHCNDADNSITDTTNQESTDATTKLIMQRYKIKSIHYPSPVISKRHHSTESSSAVVHSFQPGTSSDWRTGFIESAITSNDAEIFVASTPKTFRKWKKSKVMKHGSGSSSCRSDGTLPKHLPALGQKIIDCPTSGDGDMVPLLIRVCVKMVEAHGMDTVGIYRIPGNTAAVNALKENLSSGFENIDFADSRWRDVNVVSSLLKMFLRKLPEPLLTDKLYPFFIDASRITSHPQRLRKLRYLVRKLPTAHYETLKYLMRHLRAVVEHSSVNKMETRNLAIMFGPSIVRPSDDNMATMVTHMSDQCKIIETFITYYDWLFEDSSTVEDEVPSQVLVSNDNTVTDSGCSTAVISLEPADGGKGCNIMNTSFSDMHNLLRRVNGAESVAMLDTQKVGKIKQIWNGRHNSKREKRKKERVYLTHTTGNVTPLLIRSSNVSRVIGTSGDVAGNSQDSFTEIYQERDIDAEIATRQQQTANRICAGTNSSADHSDQSLSLGSSHESAPDTLTIPALSRLYEMKNEKVRERQICSEADEMRQQRQKQMCSARRIFIAGTDADLYDDADLDDLVSHTRHLNLVSSPTLDVLSAETREKILRMQQLQGWSLTAFERREAELATKTNRLPVRTREEVRSVTVKKTAVEEFSSTDALSLTSDYSTTSSAPLTIPVTVSCVDSLFAASSDYASSDVSPCPRNASPSPRHPESEAVELHLPAVPILKGVPAAPSHTGEMSFSVSSKVKARVKMNSHKDHQGRRYTLSDVDIIRQALQEEARRKVSLPTVSQAENMHSDFGTKVNKFARWIKKSFQRSSAVFVEATPYGANAGGISGSTTHKKTAVIVAGKAETARFTGGRCSVFAESNDNVAPSSGVLPFSCDEQL